MREAGQTPLSVLRAHLSMLRAGHSPVGKYKHQHVYYVNSWAMPTVEQSDLSASFEKN